MATTAPMQSQSIFGENGLGSKYLNPDYLFSKAFPSIHDFFSYIVTHIAGWVAIFNDILILLSIFFLAIISYTSVRMFEIRKKEHAHLHHEIEEYAHHQAEREKKAQQQGEISKNPRWVETLNYLFSANSSDWKLAIIEADAMLETLLDQLGFKGETLGDKLKGADSEKFRSLSTAWEIHTIRNKIAHEGLAYELSQHEAKRVIALYEMIFRQYGFI